MKVNSIPGYGMYESPCYEKSHKTIKGLTEEFIYIATYWLKLSGIVCTYRFQLAWKVLLSE